MSTMPSISGQSKNGDKTSFKLPAKSVAHSQTSTSSQQRLNPLQAPVSRLKSAHRSIKTDDTPRAFSRIMEFARGKRLRSGLDNGEARKSKRTRMRGSESVTDVVASSDRTEQPGIPRLLAGERMKDYSARVDAALPINGLVKKGTANNLGGIRRRQTKMERKMQKMQKQWREDDARRKALVQKDEEAESSGHRHPTSRANGKKRKVAQGSDEDPWAVLADVRSAARGRDTAILGLHDVVQAPPKLRPQSEKLKKDIKARRKHPQAAHGPGRTSN